MPKMKTKRAAAKRFNRKAEEKQGLQEPYPDEEVDEAQEESA